MAKERVYCEILVLKSVVILHVMETAGCRERAASRAVTTVVRSEGMYRWSVWACEDGGAMAGEAQKRNRERMAELPVSGARHAGGMKTSIAPRLVSPSGAPGPGSFLA